MRNNWLKYAMLNLILLLAVTGLSIWVVSLRPTLLTEELILGLFVVPCIPVALSLLIALLLFAMRLVKPVLALVPMIVLSLFVGLLIVLLGPDLIREHNNQQYRQEHGLLGQAVHGYCETAEWKKPETL
jgi:hypothetical protein